jgi:thiol-disulfide isomerase/thioredoxin
VPSQSRIFRPSRAFPAALLVVLACLPLATGCAKRPPRAHDLVFEDINPRSGTHGRTLSLSELYAERGIVLRFTASWCKSCREEMPRLQEFYAEGKTPMLFVAADEGAYRENILIVAERAGLTAPLMFVPVGEAKSVGKHYRYELIPATYFIDSNGRIHRTRQGGMSTEELGREYEATLERSRQRARGGGLSTPRSAAPGSPPR